jgi:hypothetical protein
MTKEEAIRLGYRVVKVNSFGIRYTLLNPRGYPVLSWPDCERLTEEEAWKDLPNDEKP